MRGVRAVISALLMLLCIAVVPQAASAAALSAQSIRPAPSAPSAPTGPTGPAAPRSPSAPQPTAGGARTADAAPAVPIAPMERDGVRMTITHMAPAAVTPDSTLTVKVTVTNTGEEPLERAAVQLGIKRPRLDDREDISRWAATDGLKDLGSAVALSPRSTIAPGKSAEFVVTARAADLGLGPSPDHWGARAVSLTLVTLGPADGSQASADAADGAGTSSAAAANDSTAITGPEAPNLLPLEGQKSVSAVRSFIVWQPQDAQDLPTTGVSTLVPVRSEVPAQAVTDPAGYAESLNSGTMKKQLEVARRPDADWLLDPSMLASVPVPQSLAEEPAASTAKKQKGGDEGTEGSASPSPSPSAQADDPAAAWASSEPWVADPTAAATASALTDAAEDRTVIAAPYGQFDPLAVDAKSRLAAAGSAETGRVLNARSVTPAGSTVRLAPGEASARHAQDAAGRGADIVLVPAESLGSTPEPQVTTSGYGRLDPAKGSGKRGPSVPLLAYDTRLSALSEADSSVTDPMLIRQQVLADTAVISGQSTNAPRHVLISPDPSATLDPTTMTAGMDALADAPWVEQRPTSDLVDAARSGSGTRSLWVDKGSQSLLWRGPSASLAPVAIGADGTLERPDSPADRPAVSGDVVTVSDAAVGQILPLRSMMKDQTRANPPLLTAFASTSPRAARDDALATALAERTVDFSSDFHKRVTVTMASSYNLASSSVGLPITIRNDFDTPVTVTPDLSVSKRIVRIQKEPGAVTIPPHSSVDVSVPIEAIANGTLDLDVTLVTPDGSKPFGTQSVEVHANPAWENRTTLIIVVGMAVLVVAGVIRAGRSGRSDARSPGVQTPETINEK
nr:DUF6049 family protein [Helcobacillus massiliensis]